MEDLLTFTTQLAQEAGTLLLQYYRKSDIHTHYKADHSVVTEADVHADRLITAAIQSHFPGDLILSEELQPEYRLASISNATWIIDPLDGTTNFSLGLHYWGVSITRVWNGKPDLAVYFFPLLGDLYAASLGKGATLNGLPWRVKPPEPGVKTTFFSCCSRTHRRYIVHIPYKTRILGSAAYSMCSVVHGSALVAFEAAAKIWDIAGAWLLIPEAGGVIETIDNSSPFPLVPGTDYTKQNYPTLASVTPEVLVKSHAQLEVRPG